MFTNPRSESVRRVNAPDGTETTEPDGWSPSPGYLREMDHSGSTRITVSVPPAFLARVHQDLVRALEPKLGMLYRQLVDRARPRPEGAPPRDFVGLDLEPEAVLAALQTHADLIYHDARSEVWIKGSFREQLVLDADGLIYCYPDDPVFLDVILGHGLPENPGQTIVDRDYAKHWFHAENDQRELTFIRDLRLTEVPHRKR